MRLCKCFSQRRGCSWFLGCDERFSSPLITYGRCFYLTLVHKMGHPFKLDLFVRSSTINLRFVSSTYGSLAIISCMAILTLCGLLFLFAHYAAPCSIIQSKSYLLQSYKTFVFANASNWANVILLGIASGLNVTYLLHNLRSARTVFLKSNIAIGGMLVAINPILFSGNSNVHYMLCLGYHTLYGAARRHDSAIVTLVSALGTIGIRVLILGAII